MFNIQLIDMLARVKKHIFSTFFILIFLLANNTAVISIPFLEYEVQGQEQHEVTVTLKLIQVYVTDKEGIPAMDLELKDFELFDNGKRKDLTEFERYTLSLSQAKKEKKPLEQIYKPKSAPAEEIQPSPSMNRKFFFFFDYAFNNRKGIQKSREAALHFIDTKLHPTDEIGLMSYSLLSSLSLHEFLTTNHQKVREAVEGIGLEKVLGYANNVEEQFWRNTLKLSAPDASEYHQPLDAMKFTGDAQFQKMREQATNMDRAAFRKQISSFTTKMSELAKALRYIPGHKHILLFSTGIPTSYLYGIASPFGVSGTYRKDLSVSMEDNLGDTARRIKFESMLKELAASNSQFYTLDTEDLRETIMQDEQMMGGGTMKQISKTTGGKYYGRVHNYEEIMEEIQDVTSSYYVLGYYIGEQWDGKYHKIKVNVKKKGYNVRAQSGYFNPKPFTEYSEVEKQIHLIDLALNQRSFFEDPIRFYLEPVINFEREKNNLFLLSKISVRELQGISGERVELVCLVFDGEDTIAGFKQEDVDFSELPAKEFIHTSVMTIPPGAYKCRVVIRNLQTGRGALGTSSVYIPQRRE
jgi:VWFA-related protein